MRLCLAVSPKRSRDSLHDASSKPLNYLKLKSISTVVPEWAWAVKTTDPEGQMKATLKTHRAAAVAIPHKDAHKS